MVKLSIIVPVYKVEDYLCECVDSILNQPFSDYEIILVDDGSPDRCPEMCDEYAKNDSRIKVVHKENGGLSSARNAGLPFVNGEYIWFIDSDDYILPNAFEVLEKYLDKNADIIQFGYRSKYPDEVYYESDFVYVGEADKNKMTELAETGCSSHLFTYVWRSIFRAEFIKENDLTFKNGLSFAEDSVFNSKAYFLSEKTIFADVRPYIYRARFDGISKNKSKIFDESVIKNFCEYDKIRDENYEKYCIRKSEKYYKDAGIFALNNIYASSILVRIYASENKNKFALFKQISKTEMVKKAFQRFDINTIKSNSLDWWMLWAVKHRFYLMGHLICKYILYK